MRTRTLKNLALLSLTLASLPTFAGGISGTGGNTVNLEVVSQFAHPVQEFPDFKELTKLIQIFQDRIPDFGTELTGMIGGLPDQDPMDSRMQWYLIPREIRELPPAKTGLNFPTGQSCYQVEKESFCSQSDVDRMKPASRGLLYLQEVLEMYLRLESKNRISKAQIPSDITDEQIGGRARAVLDYLVETKFNPTEKGLSKVINEFGVPNLTKSEVQAVTDKALKNAQTVYAQMLSDLVTACHPTTEPDVALATIEAAFFTHQFPDGTVTFKGEKKRNEKLRKFYETSNDFLHEKMENEHLASIFGILMGEKIDFCHPDDGQRRFTSYVFTWDNYSICDDDTADHLNKYGEKYSGLDDRARMNQACSDVDALVPSVNSNAPIAPPRIESAE